MKLTISTKAVCGKRGCNTRSKKNIRHHRRYEWEIMRNCRDLPEGLAERYYKFLPEDIVVLCEEHHEEIRSICRRVSRRYRRWQARKPMPELSATEIIELMLLLEATCKEWENE